MSLMDYETHGRVEDSMRDTFCDFEEEFIIFEDEGDWMNAMAAPVVEESLSGSVLGSPDGEDRHDSSVQEGGDSSSNDSTSSDSEEEVDLRTTVISNVKAMILSFLRQLADCAEGITSTVAIQLVDRRKPRDENGEYQMRTLVFPKATRSGNSMQGLAALMAVLTYIYEALVTGVPITKRDIYYRDVALFKRQSVVDNLVDDIAATFEIERDNLLVRASTKGLFCGSILSLRLGNGTVISGNDEQPTMIPAGDDIEGMVVEEDIGWILVVEKEAIFQTLCQVGFARRNNLDKPGVIFTGKGYPDIATRQLVHKLSSALPDSIPIFALVDADPYGIDILSCYAFGSESLYHQREGLTAERMEWLGVHFSELEGFGISQEALLPMTERDQRKIAIMLARDEEVMPEAWKDELRCMLDTRLKAEIEAVCSSRGSQSVLPLVGYVEDKIRDYFDRLCSMDSLQESPAPVLHTPLGLSLKTAELSHLRRPERLLIPLSLIIMRVNTTIDDVSPLITYLPVGDWAASTHSDVMWTEYYQTTYTMCSKLGDNATFTFTGTGIWLYGALRSNHGLYNVTLDGITETRDGYASGQGLYQQVLFSAVDLDPGLHVVTLTNNRNSTTYANLDLDFIIFEEELGGSTDTVNSTTVEDTDPAFTYGPASTAWSTIVDNESEYHGGNGHTTVSTTGFVTYNFNGSAATIYGALGPSQGPYSAQLDGGPITNYTALNGNFFPQQILWHVTGLDAGLHTVKLSNMPAVTGQGLSIDYAVASAVQVPIITSSSTSMSSTTSSTSSTSSDTSTSETVSPTGGASQSSSAPSTGVIVAAVIGSLALLAMLSFALVMFRRRKNSRKDMDDRPDMAAIWPEPYPIGNNGYGGSGRYILPSQSANDGYNPLDSSGPSPLYPPTRGPYDQNGQNTGFYNGQNHVDGASLFSGLAPGAPRGSAHSNSTHQQPQRRMSASTGLPYDQSEVASVSPYGRESAYTANSDGASRIPAHGHNTLTDITEPPLPPLPANVNANQRNLGLHSPPPPLHTGLIPPRKGQREQVTLPPSAAPDQREAFRGLAEEELRQRRMNVQGREQDFGPLTLDDEPLGNAPLPPDYTQATETFKR